MGGAIDRSRALGAFVPEGGDDVIVCRCEEITRGEIRGAVHDGMCNVHEVRRLLRCGMGLCQGQTCSRLVRAIVARELGVSQGALSDATARAPMRPVEMRVMAGDGGA
ncbi:MAG: (2Fe-2S)-binding protein [Oscillospiraceae bacterium]|jgi:NAD(P)H-nitrite reductase large subunit|nr:(2Fe-2S)-binding protein [Oscillospiraceae bacterium]